jgi:branched-chain amino acid transport system ATP-binding protein
VRAYRGSEMLEAQDIHAFYRRSHVSGEPEVRGWLSALGRNGAGKTTTLRASRPHCTVGGRVLQAEELVGQPLFRTPAVGWATGSGSRIFPDLTVQDDLRSPAGQPGRWSTPGLPPLPGTAPLRHRLGRHLSGGEQRMLAIASLMGNPLPSCAMSLLRASDH